MEIPVFSAVKTVQDDGHLTPEMQLYNDDLNTTLRNGLSGNGWTGPVVERDQLTQVNPNMPDGTFWIVQDDTHSIFEMVVKINGALRKITTTAYP